MHYKTATVNKQINQIRIAARQQVHVYFHFHQDVQYVPGVYLKEFRTSAGGNTGGYYASF